MLDYNYHQRPTEEQIAEANQLANQQVAQGETPEETPTEETPNPVRSGYFSPKKSDKLQSFISMQRTVSQALKRDIDQRQQQPTMQPVAEVGGAWEKEDK